MLLLHGAFPSYYYYAYQGTATGSPDVRFYSSPCRSMSKPAENLNVDLGDHKPLYLGQLLLRADLIDREQLDKVGGLADRPPDRLGQKLVLAGFISHAELHDVLHVQCLLREEAIDELDATKILRVVRQEGVTADEAIAKLKLQVAEDKPNSRFGDLLLEAGILDREQLGDALSRSAATGLPLGYVLEISGLVTGDVLALVRDIQKAIRAKVISREQAVGAIAAAVDIPEEQPAPAGAEEEKQAAPQPNPLSQPPQLAGFSEAGAGSPGQTIAPGYTLPPVKPAPQGEISFGEFLVLCGLLELEDMERARKMCDGTKFGIETVVKKIHRSKQGWFDLAGECFKQARLQRMTLDEAIYAFDFCKRAVEANQCTLAEASQSLERQCGISLN